MGWGSAAGDGGSSIVVDAAMAHTGETPTGTSADSWSVYYNENVVPAQFGETWRLSGFKADFREPIVDGGAAFKLEAKDAAGTVLGA